MLPKIQNYLESAKNFYFRQLYSTLFSLTGLCFGFVIFILIALFIVHETSFDTWNPEHDKIYKLEITYTPPGRDELRFAPTPAPSIAALMDYFPGKISSQTQITSKYSNLKKDNSTIDEEVFFAGGDFLDIFPVNIVMGSGSDFTNKRNVILLSESAALKYFGRENPIGKSLILDSTHSHQVVAVYEDLPRRTHFRPEYVASLPSNGFTSPQNYNSWRYINVHTYFKAHSAADASEIQSRLADFVNDKVPAQPDWVPAERMRLEILPLTDIYLHSKSRAGLRTTDGDAMTVLLFSIIGIIILVITTVNFTSMALSQSLLRIKEINVRKVIGATKTDIKIQFLMESVFMSAIAMFIALIIVVLVLPYYNEFLHKDVSLDVLESPMYLLGLVLLTIVLGLLAGVYPAFHLPSFKPGQVLRSNRSSSKSAVLTRQIIVSGQFFVATSLMIITSMVYLQTQLLENTDLGFSKDNKVQIWLPDNLRERAEIVASQFSSVLGVRDAALSDFVLPSRSNFNVSVDIPGRKDAEKIVSEAHSVGQNYLSMYEVRLLAGRLFSQEFKNDQLTISEDNAPQKVAIVVNQIFVTKAGFMEPANAINKTVRTKLNDTHIEARIVGVVEDLKVRSLKSEISPAIFFTKDRKELSYITLDVDPEDLKNTLENIDSKWFKIATDTPISRSMVDQRFAALYQSERQNTNLFAFFSILAISISCLGLYASSAFNLERKTNEIALRKVLGASKQHLLNLMLLQFYKPVVLGALVALPVSLYLLNDWLLTFKHRISLMGEMHIIALCLLLSAVIAGATIINQTLRAISRRPGSAISQE